MEDHEERWASEDVTVFDATHVPAAATALEPTRPVAEELVALGFVELGRSGTTVRLDEEDRAPVPTAADLAEAEARASSEGTPEAHEHLAWLRELDGLGEVLDTTQYAWWFAHPVHRDLACVEFSAEVVWLSFARLGEDGTIARTLRRTQVASEPNRAAAGLFHAARLPGLYALMLRLSGESQSQMMSSSPRVGYWAQLAPHGSVREAHEVHVRFAAQKVATAAPPDLELAFAYDRRTTTGTLVRIERSGEVALTWMMVVQLLVGRGASAAVVFALSGSWVHALVAAAGLLLPARMLWSWALGVGEWWVPGAVLIALAAWIGLAGAPPVAALLGFAVALTGVVVAAVGYHWLGCGGGMIWVGRRMTEPAQVPPDRLRVLYRA